MHGYPRNLEQAELLNSMEIGPNRVFYLEIPPICALERLTGQHIDLTTRSLVHTNFHSNYENVENEINKTTYVQHPDHDKELIKTKHDEFDTNKNDLINFYSNLLVKIQADRDEHTVFEEIE